MRAGGGRTMCPASLTALSRSPAASSAAAPGSTSNSSAISATSALRHGLAPAVLIAVAMTTGCFNPFYISQAQPRQNHVPVVEVFPAPSNEPIAVDLGGDCVTEELNIVSLEDADAQPLSVRYDLLRTVGGDPKRVPLREFAALAPTDGDYNPGADFGRLPLDEATFGGLNFEDDTQLVELRVADTGFVPDGNGVPVADGDGGLFFMSWMIRIGVCVPTGTP